MAERLTHYSTHFPTRALFARVKKFTALDAADKKTCIHAWLYLGWMRATILATSFKHAVSALEHHREPITPPEVFPEQMIVAAKTGRLVAAAARHTPWQSRCLVQVLVTQRLLARRGVPGQFYLGVRGSRDGPERAGGTEKPAGFSAHAWLQCGDRIVNGATGHEDFSVVSIFRWGASGPA
jgi:hypothetical protein